MEQKGNEKEKGRRQPWGGKVGTRTLDTRGTGTAEARSITGAGAACPAGMGFTGISSEALTALRATPAKLTHAAEPEGGGSQGWQEGREAVGIRGWGEASPSRRVVADAMTAGFLGAGMAWGKTERGQGARWAEALEAIFTIHAGAPLTAWAGRTLVDLHVAERPWGAGRQPHPRTRIAEPTGEGQPCPI